MKFIGDNPRREPGRSIIAPVIHPARARSIPTLIPPASIAYQQRLIPCIACEMLVPGAQYDGRNSLCAYCSVTLGCTAIADWPDDVQWYVLTVRRRVLKLEPERGLWSLIKRLARGLAAPTRHLDAAPGASVPPERKTGQ